MFCANHTANSAILAAALIVALFIPASGGRAAEQTINHDLWAELLEKYVHNGLVDYAGFQHDEAKLDRYLEALESQDPKQLSVRERYAFYINVYNAWTVKLILSAYPDISSIKDLGSLFKSPWEKPIVRLHSGTVSLDDIEHEILRPQFKDPRIHFVVNCASKGCPPLRSEPYTADKLNDQLEDATRSFLNDPVNYRLEGNDFYVSRLFKWYAEDFNGDIIGFYLKYARQDLKARLQAVGKGLTVRYLPYDWGLNGI